MKRQKILVLDFGSQTTQLIGRRIRELGVYSEILPGDAPLTDAALEGVVGIVLSGSPASVYDPGPAPDRRLYGLGLPLLGICYGIQRMCADNGGRVEALPEREYGSQVVEVAVPKGGKDGALLERARVFLAGFDRAVGLEVVKAGEAPLPERLEAVTWMSHGDTITALGEGFLCFGLSRSGAPAVILHREKPWFGLQFHPEVTHTPRGREILAAFVYGICGAEFDWTMEKYIEEVKESLTARVGNEPVLLLISGGVDSTVAGALLLKTLDPAQVHLMYMDTGLMRKGETGAVTASLQRLGAQHLHIIRCEDEFLAALEGLTDPEAKRRAIGDLFIKIQEREVDRLRLPSSYFLAQGTLYTDLIESGKGVGKKAHLIKSHHNVGTPLVAARREAGRIIEPLDHLYKDEVRRMGRLLGIDEEVIRRHPFPGPGLAVRILGEVTKEKCDILREADDIFIGELKARRGPSGLSLYDEIWQAFAVLLPVRSVGVAGDVRKYGWVLALRAITSADGMTADVYPFDMAALLEISTRITNTVREIGRVTFDVSSKPPATIEWE